MSSFLGTIPIVQIRIENPLLRKAYPAEGAAIAIIDSGYEGFVSVPKDIFREASLDELQSTKRTLLLANGTLLNTEGVHATVVLPNHELRIDGFIETYDGLEEVILGTGALANFRLLLNYCANAINVQACP